MMVVGLNLSTSGNLFDFKFAQKYKKLKIICNKDEKFTGLITFL